MTDIPHQIHKCGQIHPDNGVIILSQKITDEYLWEFLMPEEYLENIFGLTVINLFLAKGGGFQIIDIPNPLPRFHDVTVWAYHPDPKILTWLTLQKR